jgi:alkylation response protein AidB-like acyl-CoA dehydrogenase
VPHRRRGRQGHFDLVVDDGAEGLSFGGLEDKMGWRAQPTRQVQFDDCLVPAENLVGEEGARLPLRHGRARWRAAEHRRLLAGRRAGGAGRDAGLHGRAQGLRAAARPSSRRCSSAWPTWRSSCRRRAPSCGRRRGSWIGRAGCDQVLRHGQAFATETGSRVADQCLQLHGGYGYLADYGIEKIVRDLRVHQILEGTNEIMRLITARTLLAEAR